MQQNLSQPNHLLQTTNDLQLFVDRLNILKLMFGVVLVPEVVVDTDCFKLVNVDGTDTAVNVRVYYDKQNKMYDWKYVE